MGCKKVFCIKQHANGTIAKYKAHLVVKEYHQTFGLDFKEFFSLVVKLVTVRVILTLTLAQN